MDTDSFIMYIKTEYFYKYFADDIEKSMIHQIIHLKDHCRQVKIREKLVL